MNMHEANEDTAVIDILPDELLISIFKWLPLDTILECENVCSRWRKLARDAGLWSRLVFIYSVKPWEDDVNERNLALIESHQDCLRCLKLEFIDNYSVVATIAQKCQNLISLEILMCPIDKDFEQYITRWPNLNKISFKSTLLLTKNEDLTIAYDKFKYLKYLLLSSFGLPVATRDTLFTCYNLTHIFIEKVTYLDLEYMNKLIKSKMEIVQALHIYGGGSINDNTLYLLSQCKSLKDIAIVRCEKLTDAGFVNLANLNKMDQLKIWSNVNFSEAILRKTLKSPSLTQLNSLSLSRVRNVSPAIIDVISEYYKNLTFFSIYKCPLIVNAAYEKKLQSKLRHIKVVLY